MTRNTAIEWADHTFNPWWGCTRVSPGCENCYAEAWDKRYPGGPQTHCGPAAPRRLPSDAYWKQPLHWDRMAAKRNERARVFCASMADVFEKHPLYEVNDLLNKARHALWNTIRRTPHLTWMLLTKRPENVEAMVPDDLKESGKLWMGVTAEDQPRANQRIPTALGWKWPAVRFLSAEPLLEAVSLAAWLDRCSYYCDHAEDGYGHRPERTIDWVICGGESGPHGRPMHPDWARSLRDQCVAARVPFFFKQNGKYVEIEPETRNLRPVISDQPYKPVEARFVRDGDLLMLPNGRTHTIGKDLSGGPLEGIGTPLRLLGKKRAGRLLDGREWNELPQQEAR